MEHEHMEAGKVKKESAWTRQINIYKGYKRDMIANWELYVFLLVPTVWLLVFRYMPMYGVQIAFKDYTIELGIWGSPWIGLGQFTRFFNSPIFWRLIRNTLVLSLYNLFAVFPIPIILALALHSARFYPYKKFVQMSTYLPYFISEIVLVGMLLVALHPRVGFYGVVYNQITGNYPRDLMSSASAFPHLFVWSGAWQTIGFNSIIFLAALSAVDPELHEAAVVDGATRFQRIKNIDIPAIIPTVIILLILRVGHIMSIGFEKAFLMQNDLNRMTSEIISTYVYQIGLVTGVGNFSFAAAIGFFDSIINLILLVLVNEIARKVSDTSLW
ncbi:MAG: ABC transporter permease subunit [Treponema sp.]|nr:ABC transporter permease subunit [Treponema sp.]